MEQQRGEKVGPSSLGSVICSSPSNIAFVKYWGKKDVQIPRNASLSMTLRHCVSTFRVNWNYKKGRGGGGIARFHFAGAEAPLFANKLNLFLKNLDGCAWAKDIELEMNSENSFPHSSGIASSASSMSAFCLALAEINHAITGRKLNLAEISNWARQASGSAARSFYPGMSLWGQHPQFSAGRDEYAIEYSDYHPLFQGLKDAILIVSAGEKAVSSREGHRLMDRHFYAEVRFQSAQKNLSSLSVALKLGDFPTFGELIEQEAMELHGLMMTSRPSFFLMTPKTLEIINLVREFRAKAGNILYFTLDAGPNVHLIYPASSSVVVEKFINEQLRQLCENDYIIFDEMGAGPQVIKSEFKNLSVN